MLVNDTECAERGSVGTAYRLAGVETNARRTYDGRVVKESRILQVIIGNRRTSFQIGVAANEISRGFACR